MSMEELRSYYFRQLQSRVGGIAGELTRVRYAALQTQGAWHPAIDVYRSPATRIKTNQTHRLTRPTRPTRRRQAKTPKTL